jgi:hypothetical protein
MGNHVMLVVLGAVVLTGIYILGFSGASTEIVENSSRSHANVVVKEINNAAIEMALGTLSQNFSWRTPLADIPLFGGNANVTFKDTMMTGDSAVIVMSRARFFPGMDTATASSRVVVKQANGIIPFSVRGAFTAFGPIDDAISDMFIDGRNFRLNATSIIPGTGKFGVSTGQPTFVNTQKGAIGGTSYSITPAVDISPTFPENSAIIETSAPWPNGFPTTPDAALGYPEGTLKHMAVTKQVPGSQYVTKSKDLKFPLRGVTYIEVPNGTIWSKVKIGVNPEGILVFHSPNTDAFWDNITTSSGPFKGLMLFDNVFHIHMDILGGIVILTPNTVQGKTCNGNKAHWIRYSSEALEGVTKLPTIIADGSWKNKLRVVSWYE